jgi:hypothetical protein
MTRGFRRLARIGGLPLLLGLAGCDWSHGWSHDGYVSGPSTGVKGSGVLATESRAVSGFTSVSAGGASRLILERNGVESLTITAEDNILPLLTAEVVGNRLVLGMRSGVSISPTREIVFRVGSRELCGLDLSGATQAEAVGLDCDTFAADLSGASVVVASGRTDHQVVHVSGASHYRAADLRSRSAAIDLSGVSQGTVRVSERLLANVSGTSFLEYIGSPQVTVNASGGAFVRKIGD